MKRRRIAATLVAALASCSAGERPPGSPQTPHAPVATARPEAAEATAPAETRADEGPPAGEELDAPTADEGIREIPGCLDLEGPDQCVGVGKVMLGCTALGNVLGPEPTTRLVECLKRHDRSPAICEASVLETCGFEAIDRAPSSAATEATCKRILSTCAIPDAYATKFTEARCARGLASARAASRAEFTDCMLRKCDLLLCVSGLL